jgi:dethiobiotin synthetase
MRGIACHDAGMSYFITGTDTGVGKTHVTALLLRAFNEAGHPALGYKPLACGDRLDAEHLRAAGADPSLPIEVINPVFYRVPASPMAAAMIENRTPDVAAVRAGFDTLCARAEIVLVEGAGGWLVPISAAYSMADLAVEFARPVIVVVNNKLGALNHTLLTVEAIRSRGLTCAGLILNQVADERDSASISNRILLDQLLPDVPVLAEVMHGEEVIDPEVVDRLLGAGARSRE